MFRKSLIALTALTLGGGAPIEVRACIFTTNINNPTSVYTTVNETPSAKIDELGPGNAVCVLEILYGSWFFVYYARGNQQHGGFIKITRGP